MRLTLPISKNVRDVNELGDTVVWTRGVGSVYHVSIEEKFSSYTLVARELSRVTRL